jgi:hypothetical protein
MIAIGLGVLFSFANIFSVFQESFKMYKIGNFVPSSSGSASSSTNDVVMNNNDNNSNNNSNDDNNNNQNSTVSIVGRKDVLIRVNDDDDEENKMVNSTMVELIVANTSTTTSTTETTPNATIDIINNDNNNSNNTISPTIVTTTSTTTPSLSSSSSFTQCMLQLEQYLDPLILTWYESSLPMPFAVKIIKDAFYVFLNLNSMNQWQFTYWRKNGGTRYFCNDIEGGIATEVTKKSPATLIVQCPSGELLDPSRAEDDELRTFSIVPWRDDTCINHEDGDKCAYSNITMVTYNMSLFVQCERQDIQWHATKRFVQPSPPRPLSKNIKAGITTTFAGSRKRVFEWATYHHILGFDHIWIYINDEWDKGEDLQVMSRDYITWIPWNYNTRHYNKTLERKYCAFHEIFRPPSQNDALWRARRLGFDWMAFTDLDEFLVIGNSSSGGGGNMERNHAPLKEYLEQTYDKMQNHEMYDAIMLRSVPFGGNHVQQQEEDVELILDYTWRLNANLTEWWASRNKLLVRVPRVSTVNIHYIGNPNGKLYEPPATEIRVNHYKQPELGVFNGRKAWYTTANNKDEIVQDTKLRDEYRDLVWTTMNEESS